MIDRNYFCETKKYSALKKNGSHRLNPVTYKEKMFF